MIKKWLRLLFELNDREKLQALKNLCEKGPYHTVIMTDKGELSLTIMVEGNILYCDMYGDGKYINLEEFLKADPDYMDFFYYNVAHPQLPTFQYLPGFVMT